MRVGIPYFHSRQSWSDVAISGDSWPELLAAIFQLSLSPEASRRESAFRIFAITPGIIGKSHEVAVLGAFEKGFKDEDTSVCEGQVRIPRTAADDGLGPHLCPRSIRSVLP